MADLLKINTDHAKLDGLTSALQSSLKIPIADIAITDTNNLTFKFYSKPTPSSALETFSKVFDGGWDDSGLSYNSQIDANDIPLLINFLILTKLKEATIRKLAQVDARYAAFAERLNRVIKLAPPSIAVELEKANFTNIPDLDDEVEITAPNQLDIPNGPSAFEVSTDFLLGKVGVIGSPLEELQLGPPPKANISLNLPLAIKPEPVNNISALIFNIVRDKKMTLRQVSDKTGLTQAAISNFKAGSDIRLSNLIKIANALDLKVTLG